MTTQSCNKIWHICVRFLTRTMSAVHFLIEIMFSVKAIKHHFEVSFDKQNLTLVVVSYEYETCRRQVSKTHMK